MTISATIDLHEAAGTGWDAVVVGAGPAGSVAARELSSCGLRTLLVDRKSFPRNKVCGACVNGRAVAALAQLGLDGILKRSHAVPLDCFRVQSCGRRVDIPLPAGVAVTRSALDAGLLEAAVEAGTDFLPETSATLLDVSAGGSAREVKLVQSGQNRGNPRAASAKVVLLADGVGNSSLPRHHRLQSQVAASSRIGFGGVIGINNCPKSYETGTISMAVATGGYVGLVRVEDGSLNIAAALDPALVKGRRRQAEPIARILEESGFPEIDQLESANWSGTVPITRRSPRPAGRRVLMLGDAAGYVEPFTGEGICGAVCSGAAAARLVSRRLATWSHLVEREWQSRHRRLVRNRQHWCRWLAKLARHPRAVRAAFATVSLVPWLVRPIVKHLNHPPGKLTESVESHS